ncbi:MAG: TIM barrel protein [Cyanobacteria bacterium P01_F01_bin.53]
MLKFCANLTFLFRELPLLERFSAARQAGFEGVELLSPEGLAAEELADAANEAMIQVALCNASLGDFVEGGTGLSATPGLQREFREAIIQATVMATTLDCPTVHLGPSRVPASLEWHDCLPVYLDNVTFAARHLADHGITATIEPLNAIDTPRVFLNTVEQALEIMEACQEKSLRLQFDVYHIAKTCPDYLQQLQRQIDQVAHIQIADVPDRGEPGSGSLDFEPIFEWLSASTFSGWVGTEYHPTSDTGLSLGWFEPYRADR